ncbi:MAG: hypothetical protein R3234_08705 [Thermoanaerobaculia bacterium]|nr:hypothetical protein [Thermoanaerobaculia bacterium]
MTDERPEEEVPETPPDDSESEEEEGLYFFPDEAIAEEELERILEEGPGDRRAWAISHLLRYAEWSDIWLYVSRDEVREIFSELDLPENLRIAWARHLKIEAPVG